MFIAIDGNEANVERKVGVSVYTFQLLHYFKKQSGKNLRFTVYLRKKPQSNMPEESEFFAYIVLPFPFFWSQVFLPLALFFGKKPDVFFSPAHYAPRFSPVPTVVTIHDLSYFYYPNEFLKEDLYKLKNWTAYSVKNAQKIIAVSEHTKQDLIRWYKIPEHKINVIYNGIEKSIQYKVLSIKNKEKKPYILYVGTIQPRKNIATLVKAFRKFKEKYPDFVLKIAGKQGWMTDAILKEINQHNTGDIELLGYVPDEELPGLYAHAFCFVMPSLYEGFGIPVLEAMSYGCPVISSHASALPEIGADACLYFDPKNTDDLYRKLVELKEHASLQSDLIEKGKKRARQFSWQTCAQETLNFIAYD